MLSIKNQVNLIGRIGNEVELITADSGTKVLNLNVATNDTYKNAKGEKVTETQWHRLVAFGSKAEIMSKLLKKGDEVAVQGKLTHRSYEDKEGVKRYATNVIIFDFLKFGKNPEA